MSAQSTYVFLFDSAIDGRACLNVHSMLYADEASLPLHTLAFVELLNAFDCFLL